MLILWVTSCPLIIATFKLFLVMDLSPLQLVFHLEQILM